METGEYLKYRTVIQSDNAYRYIRARVCVYEKEQEREREKEKLVVKSEQY